MSVGQVWYEREATSFLGSAAREACWEREPFSAAQYPFVSSRQPYEGKQHPIPHILLPTSDTIVGAVVSTPPLHQVLEFLSPRIGRDRARRRGRISLPTLSRCAP